MKKKYCRILKDIYVLDSIMASTEITVVVSVILVIGLLAIIVYLSTRKSEPKSSPQPIEPLVGTSYPRGTSTSVAASTQPFSEDNDPEEENWQVAGRRVQELRKTPYMSLQVDRPTALPKVKKHAGYDSSHELYNRQLSTPQNYSGAVHVLHNVSSHQ